MNSMTGFGRAEQNSKFGLFTVEVSSVNSRFLEASVRLPRTFQSLEVRIKEQLTAAVKRGKVSVFVNLNDREVAGRKHALDTVAAADYCRQLRKLQKDLKLAGDVSIGDLLRVPDIFMAPEAETDLEEIWAVLAKALEKAVKAMVAMRLREGKALAADMRNRLKTITTQVQQIEKRCPSATKIYADKLSSRIESLLQSPIKDKVRLEEEVAIFAERTDIAEECTRFASHLAQFKTTLKAPESVGRRLNFLLQELNREANTIGSKSGDLSISTQVISIKEEIEKLREQVQNVE